jgi:hypothetical protein
MVRYAPKPEERLLPKISVYLPDDMAKAVRRHNLPVSAICQRALQERLQLMEATTMDPAFTTLEVQTGPDRSRTEQFKGYWVIAPNDSMRSGEVTSDAGACYGVARTARGHVAVYVYHVNDGFPALLEAYDDIEDAVDGILPSDIADEFRAEEGGVIFRDI